MQRDRPTPAERGGHAFPDEIARPLGRGLHDPRELIRQFLAVKEGDHEVTPNVERSLARFARLPELPPALAGLPREPRVLLQGYADPGNAGAVGRFLNAPSGRRARVEAVDLFDLPSVYRLLGLPPPDFTYRIADASNLRGIYPDGSVDVVVQDFLLNCAPEPLHEPILREAARILSPGGFALISFSDAASVAGREGINEAAFHDRFGAPWNCEAYDLGDMFPPRAAQQPDFAALEGMVVADPSTGTSTVVVGRNGRLEFYRDEAAIFGLFARVGLILTGFDHERGVDSHGLHCSRRRCLLRPRSIHAAS
jgi:SAM-dependent methyltransferase